MDSWTDEQGGVYSADRKTLLKCPNVKWYRVAEGTEHLDPHAFRDCSLLQELELPYTMEEMGEDYWQSDISEEEYEQKVIEKECDWGDYPFAEDEESLRLYEKCWHDLHDGHEFLVPLTVDVMQWSHPYAEEELETYVTAHAFEEGVKDEYGVTYSASGKRVLGANLPDDVNEYNVRPGVVTICDMAFSRPKWGDYYTSLTVHLPDSVKQIGYLAFPYYRRVGNDFIFDDELTNAE